MLQNTKLIAVLQAIFFIIMIIVNALANSLPMNGYTTAEVSAESTAPEWQIVVC